MERDARFIQTRLDQIAAEDQARRGLALELGLPENADADAIGEAIVAQVYEQHGLPADASIEDFNAAILKASAKELGMDENSTEQEIKEEARRITALKLGLDKDTPWKEISLIGKEKEKLSKIFEGIGDDLATLIGGIISNPFLHGFPPDPHKLDLDLDFNGNDED